MSVLVYVEQRSGTVKKAGLEALAQGRKIAESGGGETGAVVVGKGLDAVVDIVKRHGADKIFVVEDEALADYAGEGYTAAVVEAAGEMDTRAVLIGGTSQGRDLAPRVAAKMNVMLLPDVTGITPDSDNIVVRRPVYAGKVYMDLKAKVLPVVITTRPNVFDVEQADGAGVRVDLKPSYELKAKTVEVRVSAGERPDVVEADRIVSGGRGMKEPENFKLIEDLADVLGAAVGASRAVVDADWRSHSEQVGQTGKTVGPSLYIAAGISGAVQHLAGMRTSKVIVAINRDADAPIFKVADYGIVGDAMKVLPALIEELKK